MFLEKRHQEIIEKIVKEFPYHLYAFGSRVKGTHRKFSDLDLCYKEDIPFRTLRKLSEDFEDSNLPFKVDIINYNQCSSDFQKKIQNEMVLFH